MTKKEIREFRALAPICDKYVDCEGLCGACEDELRRNTNERN